MDHNSSVSFLFGDIFTKHLSTGIHSWGFLECYSTILKLVELVLSVHCDIYKVDELPLVDENVGLEDTLNGGDALQDDGTIARKDFKLVLWDDIPEVLEGKLDLQRPVHQ